MNAVFRNPEPLPRTPTWRENHRVLHNTSPFMRRAWHVAATSEEVREGATVVELLGESWNLRRIDGAVTARACDQPGAEPFEIAERYGLVWLAPEEPVAPIPDFPWWGAPGFDCAATTSVVTPVSAGQLVDNFLDAAHFPFVHTATFGTDEASEVHDRGIERDGWTIESTFDTWYRNFDDPLVATGDHPAVQPQELTKRGHASLSVVLRLGFPVTGATFGILFCCTPQTAERTRIHKLIARDDLGGDVARMVATIADEDQILQEDLAVLERYESMVLHLDPRVEVHTKADRLSVAWRRLMADFSELAAPMATAP